MAKLKLITAPAKEPLTTAETTEYLRIDGTDFDGLVDRLIASAREFGEGYQNRAYITQTWDLIFDEFPKMPLTFPLGYVQSVESVKYTDKDGVTTTVDPVKYILSDGEPAVLAHAYNVCWPDVTLQPIDGVKIRFICGFGDDETTVKQRIRQGLFMLVAHWFEHPEAVDVSKNFVNDMPLTVKNLLDLDRLVPV
jgi:uncharacterized phiE125 gp8 family phage protein